MMRPFLIVLGMLTLAGCQTCVKPPDPSFAASIRLDAFHAAAARADFNAYFECFTSDAVFLGTDATERWTVEQFKAYCKPYFDQGKGWVYTPRDRHIVVDYTGRHTFLSFDELLENAKYGTCRGTGVMVQEGNPPQWKIAQYSLSFMVPNEKAAEVTAITKPAK